MVGLQNCMTDFRNQQPPASSASPIQAAPSSCTPNVQQNITTIPKEVDVHYLVHVQTTHDPKLHRRKHKKAKAISFKEKLNSENDDQFWSTVHHQATAIEQEHVQLKEKVVQEDDDESSEVEPPPHPPHTTDPSGTSSTNSFASLQDDHEDDDNRSVAIASCDSDTDEGQVEPIDVGHHSANDSFPSLEEKNQTSTQLFA